MTLEESILKKEDIIISTVLSYLNITLEEVRSKSRKREVVFARHLVHWICRKETPLSLKAIGKVLGCEFDHSTVINSERQISGWIERNTSIRNTVDIIHAACLHAISMTVFQEQIRTDVTIGVMVNAIQSAVDQFPYNNCASF